MHNRHIACQTSITPKSYKTPHYPMKTPQYAIILHLLRRFPSGPFSTNTILEPYIWCIYSLCVPNVIINALGKITKTVIKVFVYKWNNGTLGRVSYDLCTTIFRLAVTSMGISSIIVTSNGLLITIIYGPKLVRIYR